MSDLRELVIVFALANTPLSLSRGLRSTSAIDKLRQRPAAELVRYYDQITARADRSELVMALAYAVLYAILLRAQKEDVVPVDATRLLWGERIRAHSERALIPTRSILASNVKPQIRQTSSVPSPERVGVGLFGPDGRLVSWRNS